MERIIHQASLCPWETVKTHQGFNGKKKIFLPHSPLAPTHPPPPISPSAAAASCNPLCRCSHPSSHSRKWKFKVCTDTNACSTKKKRAWRLRSEVKLLKLFSINTVVLSSYGTLVKALDGETSLETLSEDLPSGASPPVISGFHRQRDAK